MQYHFSLITKKGTLVTTDYEKKGTVYVSAWLAPLFFGYDKSMIRNWEEKMIRNAMITIQIEGIREIEGDEEITKFLLENFKR